MADKPLRISQAIPSTINIDGTPGTASPDLQEQMDIPDAYDDTVLQNSLVLTQEQAQAALDAAALANAAAANAQDSADNALGTANTAFSTSTGALATANGAQITANGKSVVYYLGTAPATPPAQDGDLWFDTAHDNQPYKHTGGAWVAAPLGNSAIVGNLDAGKITAGTLSGIYVIGNNIQTAAGTGVNGVLVPGGTVKAVQLTSTVNDRVNFYTGNSHEIATGYVGVETQGSGATVEGDLIIKAPDMGSGSASYIQIISRAATGISSSGVYLNADVISLQTNPGVFNYLDITTGQVRINSVPIGHGIALLYRAGAAPAATAIGVTETIIYTAAQIGSFTVVSGRRYKITLKGAATMSAVSTSVLGTINVRLTNVAGTLLVSHSVTAASTARQSFVSVMEFLGGTDVAAGSQTFVVTQQSSAASPTITEFYSAGSLPLNTLLLIEDIGT